MHPQLRIIFIAVTAVFAAVACSSIENVSSAIQPAHASVSATPAPVLKPEPLVAVAPAAVVDENRTTPYARPDLSADPVERKLAADAQLAIARLDFPQALRLATTPALKEMVREAHRQYNRERNETLDQNLALLEVATIKGD